MKTLALVVSLALFGATNTFANELDEVQACTIDNVTSGEVCLSEVTEEGNSSEGLAAEAAELQAEGSWGNAGEAYDHYPPRRDPHYPRDPYNPHDPYDPYPSYHQWHCSAYPNGGGHGHSHDAWDYSRHNAYYRALRSCQRYHAYCHVHCHIDH